MDDAHKRKSDSQGVVHASLIIDGWGDSLHTGRRPGKRRMGMGISTFPFDAHLALVYAAMFCGERKQSVLQRNSSKVGEARDVLEGTMPCIQAH